jgi:eukaryotic-like serine/threonine-protein kinase
MRNPTTRLMIGALLLFALAACASPAQPTPTLGIGSTMVSDKDGMTMVYVPAGEFLMGSTDADIALVLQSCPDCNFDDEKPQHTVSLDAFWIDRTDVTNAMYAQCVIAGMCKPPSDTRSYTRPNYYRNTQYGRYPVVYVSWNDANIYCIWAGRHLPTEAQWEKAARGTNGQVYPWVNQVPSQALANFNGDDTTEVGQYPSGASPYGALDMAGNVWQWVADWYAYDYYVNSPVQNPIGPASSSARVLRGGSWLNEVAKSRSAYRVRLGPEIRYDHIGFRCSLST